MTSVTDIVSNFAKTTLNSFQPQISGAQYGVGSGKFPSNLSDKYYMSLQFFKYSRQDINQIGSVSLLNSWKLPVPANMVDAQGVNYGEEEVGTALGGAASAAFGTDTNAAGGKLGQALGALGVGGAAGLLGAVSPGLKAGVSSMLGITANPFMTVMFKSPNYRTYNFSWRFYPRNPQESQSLMSLIKTIRFNQLPQRSPNVGGAVLTYPSLVRVNLIAGNSQLYPFKYGVIENSSFNYAPEGVPSFHRDGKPSTVDVSFSVKEVEYFLKDSFGGSA